MLCIGGAKLGPTFVEGQNAMDGVIVESLLHTMLVPAGQSARRHWEQITSKRAFTNLGRLGEDACSLPPGDMLMLLTGA